MPTNRPFTRTHRITSLHGITLPRKKKVVADRYITFRFVILGAVPSKKNMIWADSNLNMILKKLYSFATVKLCIDWLRSGLKVFIRNSKKYKDWMEEQKIEVLKQAVIEMKRYKKYDLVYPLTDVSVSVYHYWEDNQERDLTNKLDTLNDLFVSCGIIQNDNWQVIGKIESDCECYRGEILQQITTIDITKKIWLPTFSSELR